MTQSFKIHWPEYDQPHHCTVDVSNERLISAPQEIAWAWLNCKCHETCVTILQMIFQNIRASFFGSICIWVFKYAK